jgi:hypothetical protein
MRTVFPFESSSYIEHIVVDLVFVVTSVLKMVVVLVAVLVRISVVVSRHRWIA